MNEIQQQHLAELEQEIPSPAAPAPELTIVNEPETFTVAWWDYLIAQNVANANALYAQWQEVVSAIKLMQQMRELAAQKEAARAESGE